MITILDRARGVLLRQLVATPVVGEVIRRREPRVVLRATVVIAFAFTLAVLAPATTLAISPLVLGIPHVASSVRYLVLRRDLPRAWIAVIVLGALGILGIRLTNGPPVAEILVATVWFVAAAAWGSRTRATRIVAVTIVLALGAICVSHPTFARLGFVHVHNLGVVLIWALVWARNRTLILVPLVLAMALILSGAVGPLQTRALGVDLDVVSEWLLPGTSLAIAMPLVLAHVFTDSVHYAFWLGIIPEETLRQEGTLTFRMTWRSLRKDFGDAGIALVIGAMIALGVFAMFGMAHARTTYFAIAGFHGYVEGAMLVYLVCVDVTRARRGERAAR